MRTMKPQKRLTTIKRIEGIANLLACLGLVVLFVGVLTIINLDVWWNPLFWIGLVSLLLVVGVKMWCPIVVEPMELLPFSFR